MTYLVQFKRLRRGVMEVIRTIPIEGADSTAALEDAKGLAGTRHWPARTGSLRVMDESGHTLLDWTVPGPPDHPVAALRARIHATRTGGKRSPAPSIAPRRSEVSRFYPAQGHHRFAVGQAISYAEDDKPEIWRGGYEIVGLDDPRREPQYTIRSADQSHDRVVREHELREDLGARVRGL